MLEDPSGPAPTGSAQGRTRFFERWGSTLFLIALILIWEAAVKVFEVPAFLLPAPSDIARLTYDEWPLIQMHHKSSWINSLQWNGKVVSIFHHSFENFFGKLIG